MGMDVVCWRACLCCTIQWLGLHVWVCWQFDWALWLNKSIQFLAQMSTQNQLRSEMQPFAFLPFMNTWMPIVVILFLHHCCASVISRDKAIEAQFHTQSHQRTSIEHKLHYSILAFLIMRANLGIISRWDIVISQNNYSTIQLFIHLGILTRIYAYSGQLNFAKFKFGLSDTRRISFLSELYLMLQMLSVDKPQKRCVS